MFGKSFVTSVYKSQMWYADLKEKMMYSHITLDFSVTVLKGFASPALAPHFTKQDTVS